MKQLLQRKRRLLDGREMRFVSVYTPFLTVIVMALGIFLYLLETPTFAELLPVFGFLSGAMLVSALISWNLATTLYTRERDLRENRTLRESLSGL